MKFYEQDEYQEKCSAIFLELQSEISAVLPSAQIEHIGSSSVPGAISKGDLDIYVGVDPQAHESAVLTLIDCGYKEKLDTLRTPELCMLVAQEDIALQVVAVGSQYEFFLRFRDLLRSKPDLVRKYNELKLSCVGFSEKQYRVIKSRFIEEVLQNA
jgi:GrpB-like predicted nucleotidyltransferase (UPF0157 family)